jgi:glycosyltransferase involved in cell wall biosynthesis
VAIAVVNLPAERDRRVIRECGALEAAGYRVTVICPSGPDRLRTLPGTRDTALRTFPQPFAGSGIASFAVEFAWSFVAVAWHLTILVLTQRVVAAQVCNPPDTFWPLALLMRAIRRPWIFDHHDLNPELYECKTEDPNKVITWVLLTLERLSMRCASAVISTNESYREIAINRAGCHPDRVAVVRNGPALSEVGVAGAASVPAQRTTSPLEPAQVSEPGATDEPDEGGEAEPGRPQRHRIAYVGVLNVQDRVDLAVLAADQLTRLRGRTDWEMVIAGDGECLADLRQLVAEHGLADVVRFTGWLEAVEVDQLLRGATIAIQPDPRTQMAELSTMAKTVEYLARGLPIVAVNLRETVRSAGNAGVYVDEGSADGFATLINDLLDDPDMVAAMRKVALDRFHTMLAWDHQAKEYLRVWQSLVPVPAPEPTFD